MNRKSSFQPFATYIKRQRIESIDLVKAAATLFVILGHCISKFTATGFSTPLFNFIWLLQIPLFMFASGFLSAKEKPVSSFRQFGYRLAKNCLSLLYPCITFLLISCLFSWTNPLDSLISFFYNPQTGLWFLWVLFVIHFLFDSGIYLSSFLPHKVAKFFPVLLTLSVSLAIIVLIAFCKGFNSSILSFKLLAYYIPFFCLGYLFRLLLFTDFFTTKKGSIFAVLFFLLSVAVLFFEIFFFDSIYAFDDSNPKYLFIRFIGSLFGVYFFIFIADLLCRTKFFIQVSRVGKFSLESYYLHIIVLRFLNFSANEPLYQWLISIGASLLLIISVGLIIAVSYFIPFSHLLLFGKSFSPYKFEKKLPKIFR